MRGQFVGCRQAVSWYQKDFAGRAILMRWKTCAWRRVVMSSFKMRRGENCGRALATGCLGLALCVSTAEAQQASNTQWLDLPTSKQLMLPALGNPQRVNSLPMALAVSAD